MNRTRTLIAAMFAVLAFSAVSAVAAQAENAPYFTVGKVGETKRLKKGETRNISAKIFSATYVLNDTTAKLTITCKANKVAPGAVLLGSEEGEPGTNDEVIEFSECTAALNGVACTVAQPIVTKPLKSELAEATDKKTGLTLFKPETGTAFVTLKFTAGPCPESTVTGTVAAEGFFDNAGVKGVKVELGGAKGTAESWLLQIIPTTPKKVIKYKAGVGTETSIEPLEVAGTAATLEGTSLILLANAKGESTKEFWSPLA